MKRLAMLFVNLAVITALGACSSEPEVRAPERTVESTVEEVPRAQEPEEASSLPVLEWRTQTDDSVLVLVHDGKYWVGDQPVADVPGLKSDTLLVTELRDALQSGDAADRERCLVHATEDLPYLQLTRALFACGMASKTELALNIGPVKMNSGVLSRSVERTLTLRAPVEESYFVVSVGSAGWNVALRPSLLQVVEGCPVDGPTVCFKERTKLEEIFSATLAEFPSLALLFSAASEVPISSILETLDALGAPDRPLTLAIVQPGGGSSSKSPEAQRLSLSEAIERHRSPVKHKAVDRDQVRERVRAKRDAMKGCYNDALARGVTLEGQWTARFVFGLEGKVTQHEFAERPEKTDKEFEACLLKVVSELEVDPVLVPTIISYPFRFSVPK